MPLDDIVWGGYLGLTALVFAYGWWRHPPRRARRFLWGARRKRLAETVDGERARIAGVARGGPRQLVSPLTDRRCIGFSFRIDESVGGSWQVILEVKDCYPFELVADGAFALVKGPFLFGLEIDARGGDGAALAPSVRESIERLCEPRSGPWGRERKLRFSEAILAEGDPIEVLGTVSVSVDPRGHR